MPAGVGIVVGALLAIGAMQYFAARAVPTDDAASYVSMGSSR